jgi:hypothetical protein
MKLKQIAVIASGSIFISFPSMGSNLLSDSNFTGLSLTTCSSPTGLFSGTETNTANFGVWSVSAAGTAVLGSSIEVATDAQLGWPTPLFGTNEIEIALPLLNVGGNVGISQTLSQQLAANSIYDVSISIDPVAGLSLLDQSSLQLMAGGTVVDSVSDASLAQLDTGSGYQTINLQYETGSTPPTGNIGVAFDSSSLSSISGDMFLDDMQLNVTAAPEPSDLLPVCGVSLLAINIWKKRSKR